MPEKTIWTVGHSTHAIETFLEILKAHGIEALADIRRFPASRRYPHFNKDLLARSLAENGIAYEHFESLGGRRTPAKDSRNAGWRNAAFRGYADFMLTDEFRNEALRLAELARTQRTAYMCSEAVWWSCHRALVSDYFKSRGWNVMHIMNVSKTAEHPWTKPARLVNGELTYSLADQLDL